MSVKFKREENWKGFVFLPSLEFPVLCGIWLGGNSVSNWAQKDVLSFGFWLISAGTRTFCRETEKQALFPPSSAFTEPGCSWRPSVFISS